MNRRMFSKSLAGGLAAASLKPAMAQATPASTLNFSVMLWTVFRNLPFEERLAKVAEAGYTNVELVGEYHKWSESEFRTALAKKKELGLTFDVTAGLPHGIGNPADREAMLTDVRNELPIMERLEIPAVIIMSGNVVPGMPSYVQHQSCIDGLKAAAKLVEGKKINGQPVRLLLENIDPLENPRYYLTSVAEGFEIMREVDHPQVQFLYDFFHEQIAEGNLLEKLEKNIEYTGLVHIADVPGRHAPGTGEINFGNIYRKLVQLNYKRMVAMEFIPLGDAVTELRTAREQAMKAAASV
jgi:hydroxypyruvate isomerase